MSYEAGAKRWDVLRRAIVREWPECKLLRVFEMHPNGHGLHVHAVTPDWLSVRRMLALAKRCGFGRIHVVRWDSKKGMEAGTYIAKYLSKERPEFLKRKRLYGTIGIPDEEKTFQSDISFNSPLTFIWRVMRHHPEWETWRFSEKARQCNAIFRRSISVEIGLGDEADILGAVGPQDTALVPYLVSIGTIRQGRAVLDGYFGRERQFTHELKKKLDKSAESRQTGSSSPFWLAREPTIEQEIEAYEYHRQETIDEARQRGILCPF